MRFVIAATFTDSLARLTDAEQKQVKTTAFDLQIDPTGKGLSFHRIERGKDKQFWSVRVSRDLRLIVHRAPDSLLLCYVAHHDDAYAWAERRRLETHPSTGAAQFVEIRERVQEILVPTFVASTAPAAPEPALRGVAAGTLLAHGVPQDWVAAVLGAAGDDDLLEVATHLPAEAAEAVLALATGQPLRPATPPPAAERSAFEHPDAMRRFRVLEGANELEAALSAPWDAWTLFLHPAQRQLVERAYPGPARVAGSAGTGKTIVAVHRAAHLARTRADWRVLVTTFSAPLAHALRAKVMRLITASPRLADRIEVEALDAVGERLHGRLIGGRALVDEATLRSLLCDASRDAQPHAFGERFLAAEWRDVVDAWQLATWEAYRDVRRLGRRTRLSEQQRATVWRILDRVRTGLDARRLMTHACMFSALAERLATSPHPPFDAAVVDESQDLSIAQLRFLAALGRDRPDALFFAGDIGQRIFQQAFSWKAAGVDVHGRAHVLRVNYRTSHQIRRSADALLAPELTDVDGIAEERRGAQSVFNGPEPIVATAPDAAGERALVVGWLQEARAAGIAPGEIGVFVRSVAELPRAQAALAAAGIAHATLDDRVRTLSGAACVAPMHLAKGLEFRAVAVMACDDEIMPLAARIADIGDEADLDAVYETERHLLYVACTRARDRLLVTGVQPASEFLADLAGAASRRERRA